jgi:hypothetical protein
MIPATRVLLSVFLLSTIALAQFPQGERRLMAHKLISALLLCCLALPLPAFAQTQGAGTMQKYVIERDLAGAGQTTIRPRHRSVHTTRD